MKIKTMNPTEQLVMMIMLKHAHKDELTCVVACDYNGKTLTAEVDENGELSFHEDKARLLTDGYAKWLVNKLTAIRDSKGLQDKDIKFYVKAA